MAKKYDVALLGWWYGKNYGSILTYFGLNRAMKNLGYEVLMVHEPLGFNGWRVKWPANILSIQFAEEQGYNFTQQEHYSKLHQLNELVDKFMVGSDQLWNPHIGRVNDDLFLDFVDDNNKRFAYGTSFGNQDTEKFKTDFILKHKYNLSKFDAISVREKYAVDIAKDVFEADASLVTDPVFLLERSEYDELAAQATITHEGEYMSVFFLDPTPQKKSTAVAIADKLGFEKIVVIPNPDKGYEPAKRLFSEDRFVVIDEASAQNFLRTYKDASYSITDSFHGTAFAVLYNNPFSSIYNTKRGADRFDNLLGSMGFGDSRRVYEEDTVETISANPNVKMDVDFELANHYVTTGRKESLEWLKAALSSETAPKAKSVKDPAEAVVNRPKFATNSSNWKIRHSARHTTLKVLTHDDKSGQHAFCNLPVKPTIGRTYRIKLKWLPKSTGRGANIHLRNPETGEFKIIGQGSIEKKSKAARTTFLQFKCEDPNFSQLMIGAVHFSGPRAGAEVKSIAMTQFPGDALQEPLNINGSPLTRWFKPQGVSPQPTPVQSLKSGNATMNNQDTTQRNASKVELSVQDEVIKEDRIKELLLANKFVFYRADKGGEALRQDVIFNPDGSLENVSQKNEAYWSLDGDKLTISSKLRIPTTVFENLKSNYPHDGMRLVGRFLLNKNVKHVLETVATSVKRSNSDADFVRVKLVIAKLRDYGIKDVVIAPGGRDVVLNRAIENHANLFNIHYVLDERSAGYFAMGIANKTKRTTAVIVTSGTAASNLAPAMAEAYYMNLPLLAITADRYPEFHGIGEDQTVEQNNMFEPMVRKSVELRGGMGKMSPKHDERLISDAILSTRDGPAHINIPTNSLPPKAPIRAAYELPKTRHISRVSPSDDDEIWRKYEDTLRNAKKILLLYRQGYKPTPEQMNNINKFAQRYNVVIVADWLSNIQGPQVVHPFNALRDMSQGEFNEDFLPDLVISVGTKNVMNHPINFKLRNAPALQHWDIEPHGSLRDLYFQLTDVLHVSNDWFFNKFANLGGEQKNDGNYLKQWQAAEEEATPPTYRRYTNQFVVQQLLKSIPEKSLLHIGVGSSFMLTHSVNTVPNKELEVFLNMGTNGIDGSASAFMGQVATDNSDRLKFLLIGDVSFFYDMNSVWNKELTGKTRILLVNNSGSSLLKHYGSVGSYAPHSDKAEGWVKSVGFTYISSHGKVEFSKNLKRFVSDEDAPLFFEVFL